MAKAQDEVLRPDEEAITVKSYLSWELDSPPSCLEFVPLHPEYPYHFVVGTYHLDTDEHSGSAHHSPLQTRTGSLQLFALQGRELKLLESLATQYAVLDLHFSSQDNSLFAVATSTGAVDLYHLSDPPNAIHALADSLSGERSPSYPDQNAAIGITLSNGQVGYISYTDSEQVIRLKHTHFLEAWTVAWSEMDAGEPSRFSLFSGGDDSLLCKMGDSLGFQKCDDSVLQLSLNELTRDTKTHNAGVTAILPTNIHENGGYQVVITGSYDEHVRVLLFGSGIRRSQVLAERRVHGGGVWRLKLLSFEDDRKGIVVMQVLASCMHAGTRVLNIHRSSIGVWSVRVAAEFLEHNSMNYASDAQKSLPAETSGMTVVSTSFYDRKLCVWDLDGEQR